MDGDFKLNGRLDVSFEENDYKSTIQDVSEDYIAISVPIKDGMYVTPHIGDKLEIFYYENFDVYRFQSIVTKRKTENNVPQIILARPEIIKKVQRRQFVRVPVISYIQYIKLGANETFNDSNKYLLDRKECKALLMDISGGGMRMKVYDAVKTGDRIITDIPSENDKIRVTGQIVRTEKGEDGRLICGVSFAAIDNRTREKIIQLIFTIMRKQRKTL